MPEQLTYAYNFLSLAGAAFCAGAYVYAFLIRPKGPRRMHEHSLLMTGVALASVPWALAEEPLRVARGYLLVGLLLSVVCQALAAFRGRRSDRAREARPASDEPLAPQVTAQV